VAHLDFSLDVCRVRGGAVGGPAMVSVALFASGESVATGRLLGLSAPRIGEGLRPLSVFRSFSPFVKKASMIHLRHQG
jgi:hypothetical protein